MGSGCRVAAGPANDARCVCDVEALQGGRVQVKAQPGSGPLRPVTKAETQAPSRRSSPVLLLSTSSVFRGEGQEKNKIKLKERGNLSLKFNVDEVYASLKINRTLKTEQIPTNFPVTFHRETALFSLFLHITQSKSG